uniref:Rhodanese domain-containing protein n=1 Tax=Percolomonas cosmopolitus TaxID=63605 RepID=A0A7S1KKY8_9EUKA|mmetsp:Transcript_10403/g.38590  ORF Transcript_10403/g.38590 Transcript_10403/m.38590 type:complete len:185 (+) Transcript_10403:67-621(+)|eukprot:CAMPEP_0117444554 /NCGR_PEP_ID=MMETSP0759-20121206/5303_1 /TAXON_ID=63605 /ORGANISM="Percolomonas cosmopolitus, Strain WS" /LENGTH=184 /DNA_ID=CAMNT_0005236629 /DNA_START=49 /DNA_END=603 /DNA_ORIENTATION=+
MSSSISTEQSTTKPASSVNRMSLSISVPPRTYTKISPSDLKTLLQNESNASKCHNILIDVRDDDIKGGVVIGSIHLPAFTFEKSGIDTLEKILKSDKYASVENVIFTSMYSSNRAPNCSSFFTQWMEKELGERKYNVFIVSSGLTGVLKEWGKDSDLIENYDSDKWNEELGMYKDDLPLTFPGK